MATWEWILLLVVFLLVIFLGMQIQIQGLIREVEELKKSRGDS